MRHPRERGRLDRREFLQRSAGAAIALSGSSAFLAACSSEGGDAGGTGTTAAPFELARQDNPVTLPLYDDNPAIAADLEPEAGPLKIYNWIDYLDKKTLKKFGKEFGVKTEITIFNTMDEAVAKLGAAGSTSTSSSRLPTGSESSSREAPAAGQPRLPSEPRRTSGRSSRARSTTSARATRSRTSIYTTGIGYRMDHIEPPPDEFSNPYDIYYEETYRGKTYLLDDYREAIAMLLLRNGVTDMNTDDRPRSTGATQDLLASHRRRQRQDVGRSTTRTSPKGRRGCTRPGRATSSRPSTTSRRVSDVRRSRLLVPA